MTKHTLTLALATAVAVSASFHAAAQEAEKKSPFSAGGDVRFRIENRSYWPATAGTGVGLGTAEELYLRNRTRVWGKYEEGDFTAYLRFANEFRHYEKPTFERNPARNKRDKFPDEIFIDNLYFDFKNVADMVTFRIGRQDIRLGSGRLVSDGTPGDGSRSVFFDAVRATIRLDDTKKNLLDIVGTYNRYDDPLTIWLGDKMDSNIKDLTRYRSGPAPKNLSEMDEYGTIAYLTLGESKTLPTEFYYIWKGNDEWKDRDNIRGSRNIHTVGARALPKFDNGFSAEIEAAGQFGNVAATDTAKSRDIAAWMLAASATWKGEQTCKPVATLGTILLSGDKNSWNGTTDGSTDNSWDPVFNRATWIAEIPANMYDNNRWSNLAFIYAEAAADVAKGHRLSSQFGTMYALEKDYGAKGNERGMFVNARYSFPVFNDKGINISGALYGEMMFLGDYYNKPSAANDAYFARFEIVARF